MTHKSDFKAKAAAIRACSVETSMEHYREKFEQIAREWEAAGSVSREQSNVEQGHFRQAKHACQG
jgi:hypothetical protein